MKKKNLTEQEKLVLANLVNAWNEFIKLPVQHSEDTKSFSDAIHKAEHIVMIRPTVRTHPKMFVNQLIGRIRKNDPE